VALLFAVLVLVFLYQSGAPKKFVWIPTFAGYDRQPFGSFVFDDVVSSSVAGYRVVNRTFPQLYRDGDGTRSALLLTENDVELTEADLTALFGLLKQGNKIMLCLGSFPQRLRDSLDFSEDRAYAWSLRSLEHFMAKDRRRERLTFGTDSLRPELTCAVFPHLQSVSLRAGEGMRCDSSQVLARNWTGQPVAMRLCIGGGELFLVSTPLMFTNYGLLDGGNASYAFRLLSCMGGLPLRRIGAYGVAGAAGTSPLRYLLSQPALRWATGVALATLLAAMISAARRRQRPIPVVRPPAGETLRFACLIADLYRQKKDYAGMLRQKYRYFCMEMKRINGLDLQSGETDEALARRLAEKTGREAQEVWPAFRELKYLLREDSRVSETDMMRFVDRMNDWMKQAGTGYK
jgi:hypothetical protein